MSRLIQPDTAVRLVWFGCGEKVGSIPMESRKLNQPESLRRNLGTQSRSYYPAAQWRSAKDLRVAVNDQADSNGFNREDHWLPIDGNIWELLNAVQER